MPAGRPSKYNKEIAELILNELIEGKYLNKIIKEQQEINPDFPNRRTVYRWTEDNEEFRHLYARAQYWQLESWAGENLEIADDDSRDQQPYKKTTTYGNGTVVEEEGTKSDNTAVNRANTRINARQWLMSRLGKAKYSEKVQQELSGPGGAPIAIIREIEKK